MKDEEYLFRSDCRDKKNVARSARYRRTHNGKSGRVRLPSDNMTKKELNKMNGEVKSYRLNEPMPWKEFKAMPDDIKITYIKLLREKFHCFDSAIAEMMGVSKVSLSHEIKRLGLGHGEKHGGNRKWEEKEAFYAWAHGVKQEEEPIAEEETEEPVVEETEEPVPEENACASLNYEAEYEKAMQELKKAECENNFLRVELRQREEEMKWLYGFKAAVEMIFKGGLNGT